MKAVKSKGVTLLQPLNIYIIETAFSGLKRLNSRDNSFSNHRKDNPFSEIVSFNQERRAAEEKRKAHVGYYLIDEGIITVEKLYDGIDKYFGFPLISDRLKDYSFLKDIHFLRHLSIDSARVEELRPYLDGMIIAPTNGNLTCPPWTCPAKVKFTDLGTPLNISGECVNKIVGCLTLSKAKNKFGFRVVKSSTPAI